MCGTVVYCLLLCSFLHLTEGEAFLSMRFVSFYNSRSANKYGYCCDGNFIFCGSACDHSFTICLDRYEGSSRDISSCSFGKFVSNEILNRNNIIFGDTIGSLANPIVWRMNSWPHRAQVKIDIVDVDDDNNDDDVDFLQRSIFLQPNAFQQSVRLTMENRVQLTVDVRVYCGQHYYGGNCATYCYPRNDAMGHYTCNRLTGNKDCLTGWTGRDCNVDENNCIGISCRNGGTCQDRFNSFKCKCQSGFIGRLCEEDINECIQGFVCSYGDCVNTPGSFMCKCYAGYSGNTCETNINDCLPSPCQNNAICIDQINGFSCLCTGGYTGKVCDTDLDECKIDRCQNNGTCVNYPGGYRCDCLAGYHSNDCSLDIDECNRIPCQNGARCNNFNGGYSCECATGFEGSDCDTDVDECANSSTTCHNNGSCVNTLGSHTCLCQTGYSGLLCEVDVDECVSNPCKHRSECTDLPGGYSCLCEEGYTGTNCAENINECLDGICKNGASCLDLDGSFYCTCSAFWEGRTCEKNVNECHSHPCKNGGTCHDILEGFFCVCSTEFVGRFCESDLNECDLDKTCENNSTCVNGFGNFTCDCLEGWKGRRCEEDINECEISYCNNMGTCMNTQGGFRCLCSINWHGSRCEVDVNECELEESPCRNNAECYNLIGAFYCECSEGWTGSLCNGDIDECLQTPDVCTKLDNSKGLENTTNYHFACVNTKPGYLCPCVEGWTGPLCNEDVDECLQVPDVCTKLDNSKGLENTTNYHFACVNTKPGYLCHCKEGWTGELCNEDVDECLQVPDVCTNLDNSKGLENTTNYHFACVNTKPGYLCHCKEGWTGELCNEDVDECLQVPDVCTKLDNSKGLENTTNYHFACVNTKPGYLCPCEEGWTGPICNEDVDECLQVPDVCTKLDTSKGLANTTNYHFACVNTKPGYLCPCVEGWTGPHCNEDVNECLQVPDVCTNLDNSKGLANTTNYHFACVNTKPGYLCHCKEGWTGELCNEDVDECLQVPDVCTKLDNSKGLENTTNYHFACVNTKPGYLCPCKEGWTGPLCNEDVDECLQIPDVCTKLDNSKGLENTTNYHFACVNTKPGYLCPCKEGWTGPLCNEDVDECLQVPDVCTNLDNSKGLENTTNYHFACVNTKPGYLCPCEEGWTGELCNEDVDECLQIPDVCTNLDNSKGLENTTNHHFACVNTKPGYLCPCEEGWTGELCNEDVDECLQVPDVCTNLDNSKGLENTTNYHFACVNTKPGYLCPCVEGWTGELCNEDVDECLQIPDVCTKLDNSKGLENTTNYHFACVNTKPGYLCPCVEGWTGPLCNEDVDECLQVPDVCTKLDNSKGLENTTNYHFACVNTKPGYLCQCVEGWTGPHCNEDVNECLQVPDVCTKLDNSKGLANTTNYHFACVNTKPGYLCHCKEGWTGELCNEDVDECLQVPDVCTKLDNSKGLENTTNYHFACVNTKPGYLCPCKEGWTGPLCNEDVDECLQIPDVCTKLDNSKGLENTTNYHFACVNTKPGYLCPCVEGWTGPLCNEDVDECLQVPDVCTKLDNSKGLENTTNYHFACVNTKPGYLCPCEEGWTGELCNEDVDECLQIPDVCTNLDNSKGLENTTNYHFACVNTKPGYLCPCVEGWTGPLCNEDVDECLQVPDVCTKLDNSTGLENVESYHFSCTNTHAGYLCTCSEGWTGHLCNEDIDECTEDVSLCVYGRNSTENGILDIDHFTDSHSVCLNTFPGFVCICSEKWTGQNCDVNIVDDNFVSTTLDYKTESSNSQNISHSLAVSVSETSIVQNEMYTSFKPDLTNAHKDVSVPFYLACQIPPNTEWAINKGLMQLFIDSRLFQGKKLKVNHKSGTETSTKGLVVTSIYPIVTVDDKVLSDTDVTYVINLMSHKIEHYLHCSLFRDSIQDKFSISASAKNSASSYWYPALITACAVLVAAVILVAVIKSRRRIKAWYQNKIQDTNIEITAVNPLYLSADKVTENMDDAHCNIFGNVGGSNIYNTSEDDVADGPPSSVITSIDSSAEMGDDDVALQHLSTAGKR